MKRPENSGLIFGSGLAGQVSGCSSCLESVREHFLVKVMRYTEGNEAIGGGRGDVDGGESGALQPG